MKLLTNLLSDAIGAIGHRVAEMFGVIFLSHLRAEAVRQLGEQQERLLTQARRIEQEHGAAGRSIAGLDGSGSPRLQRLPPYLVESCNALAGLCWRRWPMNIMRNWNRFMA